MPSPTYIFDPTGNLVDNLITNEQHAVQSFNYQNQYFVIPEAAPFFGDSVIITLNDGVNPTRTLTKDVDYTLALSYWAASRSIGVPIYGGIALLGSIATGTIALRYQTIGGAWVTNSNYIREQLVINAYNPRMAIWDVLTNVQEIFPPINHEHNIDTLFGMDSLITAINNLAVTIQNRPSGNVTIETIIQQADISSLLTANGKILPQYLPDLSISWNSLSDKPALAAVATSGNYADLINKPTITQLAALSLTYTGTPIRPFAIFVCNPPALQTTSTDITVFTGKWSNYIDFNSFINLTTLTFDDLEGCLGFDFNINNLSSIVTITGTTLKYVSGNFYVNTNSSLVSVSFNALETIGGNFNPQLNPVLNTLNFNSLAHVGMQFYPYNNALLTSLNFNSLVFIGSHFIPNNNPLLNTLSFNSLTFIGGQFSPYNNSALTSIDFNTMFPVLNTIGNSVYLNNGTQNTQLTNFKLGSSLKKLGGNFTASYSPLNQASVDNILIRLAALDGTNGTTSYDNMAVTITGSGCSAPSAAGLTAKATLVARGCTVTTM